MTELSDELLNAYLDGELSPVQSEAVEQALASDPSVRERLDRLKALDISLRAALPVQPPALEDPIAQRILRPKPAPQPWSLTSRPFAAAMAAGLVGVAVGLFAPSALAPAHAPPVQISNALDKRLSHQPSGQTGSDVAIQFTFLNKSGAACRQFSTSQGDGVACRDAKAWQVVAWAANPHAAAPHFASAGASEAIDLFVDSIDASGPLSASEERAALARD